MTFGGAIVPRAGTDGRKGNKTGASVGTPDLMMRALTLVGNGAKHIWWFAFGPEQLLYVPSCPGPLHSPDSLLLAHSPGNCYSEEAIGAAPTYPGGQNDTRSELFEQIASASRMIAGADDLLFEGEMPYSSLAILYPRSSWMWDVVNGSDHDDHDIDEDQGSTEMDYQAVVYGLFRAIGQYSNRQVDFIDEDSLTAEGLAPFRALIVTEPNVPTSGQEAILKWVAAGGHLATCSGAMASDRYARPTSTLSDATGVTEAPRARVMDTSHQGHKGKQWPNLVHNASGQLGRLSAYIVRSHFTRLGGRSTALAVFETDNTPAVVRSDVGQGRVTQFGFLPTTPFPFMDAYDPSPDFNRAPIDGSIPYLLDFLDQAGVAPRVNITSADGTNVERVETPLLVSDAGAVLTILCWQTRAVPPAPQPPLSLQISVRVELKAKPTAVDSVALGKPLEFTCTPVGANSTGRAVPFVVRFSVDVLYGDFVRIKTDDEFSPATMREITGRQLDDDDHHHAALWRQHALYSQRHTAPPALQSTGLSAPPAPPSCPWPDVAAAVNASGMLSVKTFNRSLHGSPGPSEDGDGPAVRWAINASKLCGGSVFFPQGRYELESTVLVPKQTTLLGAGAGSVSPRFPESASIHFTGGAAGGPAFLLRNVEKIRFENLVIVGSSNAISVLGCALIRIVSCGVQADDVGVGADDVNTSATGCSGCNVVLHSNNTALLVENTYWLWVEDSSFSFYPIHGANHSVPRDDTGQRPSVILRGNGRKIDGRSPVTAVYLVYFRSVVFEGGGVQYQQVSDALGTWPGFFTFHYCQSENTATPLLDVQARSGLSLFNGLQAITITEYMPADTVAPHYLNDGRYPSLVAPGAQAGRDAGRAAS